VVSGDRVAAVQFGRMATFRTGPSLVV